MHPRAPGCGPGVSGGAMPDRIVFGGLALIFVGLGIPLARRRVTPNRWYGFRIPATFADPNAWYEANAMAGRDLVAVGAILAGLVLLVPTLTRFGPDLGIGIFTAVSTAGSLASLVRTWRYANRLRRKRPARGGGTGGRA